jgi:hypothetical protein
MRVLLRSRLHRVRSARVALLAFTGRRSGRRYCLPVTYWQPQPAEIVCLTSAAWSRWWVNLDGTDVEVTLRGCVRRGSASLVSEAEQRQALVSGFLAHNRHDAHHYGVARDSQGRPTEDGVARLAEDNSTKIIAIRLGAG